MVSLGTLIVIVIKARNLPNKVRIGKQNPYATISYGITKKKTTAIERGGQAPEWDQEFRFEISEEGPARLEEEAVVGPTGGVSANTAPPAPQSKEKVVRGPKLLRFACWADDARDPRIIGEGSVDLDIVLKKGTFDAWVPLENKARPAGEVYLEMTFYSNSSPPPQALNKTDSMPALLPGAVVPPNGIGYGGPGLHLPLEPTLPEQILDNSGRLSVVSQGGGDRRGSRTSLGGSELSSISHYPDADFGPLAQSFSNISLRQDLPPPLPLPPARPLSQSSSYRPHSAATYHPLPPPSLAQSQSFSRPLSSGGYSAMPQPGGDTGYDGRTTLYPQYDPPYQTGSHSMGYNFESSAFPPAHTTLPAPPPLPSPVHSTYTPDPYRQSYSEPPPPQFQAHPTPPHAPSQLQYPQPPPEQPYYSNELGRSGSTIRPYDLNASIGYASQGRNGSVGGLSAGSGGQSAGGSGFQELAKDFYQRDSQPDFARRDSYPPPPPSQTQYQYQQDLQQQQPPYPPQQHYLPPSNSQQFPPQQYQQPPQQSYAQPQQRNDIYYAPPPPQQQQDPYQTSPTSNRYQSSPAPPPLLPIPPPSNQYQQQYASGPPSAGGYGGDYFQPGYVGAPEGGNDGSRTPILSPIPTLPPPPPPELGDYLANQFQPNSSVGAAGVSQSIGGEGGYYRAPEGYQGGVAQGGEQYYSQQPPQGGEGRFEQTNSSASYYPPGPPQQPAYQYQQPRPPSNPQYGNAPPPSNYAQPPPPTSLYEEHYPSYHPPAPPASSGAYGQNDGNSDSSRNGAGYSYGVQQGSGSGQQQWR